MPKTLHNELCRTDTKKSSGSSTQCKKLSIAVAVATGKVLADKTPVNRKKTSVTVGKAKIAKAPFCHETKLKSNRKNATNAAVCVKTRSGVGVKDVHAAEPRTVVSKMKEKTKTAQHSPKDGSKAKAKEATVLKKAVLTTAPAAKKDAKKAKSESSKSSATIVVADKSEVRNDSTTVTNLAVPPKKDLKKRREQQADEVKKAATKNLKRTVDEDSVEIRKECSKVVEEVGAPAKKDTKTVDERCMAPKKRIKHKCAVDGLEVKKELATMDEKQSVDSSNDSVTCPVKNVKFFKSKNKKIDKCKDVPSAVVKSVNDAAFSIYDNLDDDSEESTNKTINKRRPPKQKSKNSTKEAAVKMRQRLEDLAKSKLAKSKSKKVCERNEKRKLEESESDVEANIRSKKMKRVHLEDGEEEEEGSNSTATDIGVSTKQVKNAAKPSSKKSSNKNSKLVTSKMEDESGTSSSDNAPLNRLIAVNKKTKSENTASKIKVAATKREALTDDSEIDSKGKKTKTKAAKATASRSSKSSSLTDVSKSKTATKTKKVDTKSSKSVPKKSVRFTKEAAKPPPKTVPRRGQRMASLNALAMVHCMYENEGKSVSISSFDSTENSDDNSEAKRVPVVTVSTTPSTSSASSLSTMATAAAGAPATATNSSSGKKCGTKHPEMKDELKETTVVKFEPRLEEVIDPVISRESLRSAPGLRSVGKHWDMNGSSISSTVSDDNVEATAAPQPIPVKQVAVPEKPSKNALKKKFARSFRRPVSDDSSEEEKHRVLLMEEKQRMMRRRRRQRKDVAMDLKDMVVCKRMASLNATAILAASYSSSTTGKRTITVKSSGKAEQKRENVENYQKTESLITKIKGRKLPFIRKKFCSSSDADVEDEADLSAGEVVVKTTASSSGKQQVSLIVNQDSGVTITGLYLNSTTKSTHRQGYCSISGMQYRISSTSHTQTEATTVTTEAIVRTPQDPLRPAMTASMHADRQALSPAQHNVAHGHNHPSPVKTYTPLGALSSMQPPGSPHHLHHHHHHPKAVAVVSSTQETSSLERHGCPSAFSAPTVYGPPPPPPTIATVAARPPYPLLSKSPPEPPFVAGYYQPAGPLISHHHHHHHHHHHVQTNSTVTTSAANLSTATATSTSPSASTISFTKVSQSPLVQPPTPPASNVTQPISELSDNEMASATTPAAEITVSESVAEETNYPLNYRFNAAAVNPPSFRSSPSHNYQTYYPSPPSTASLSHPPPSAPQTHFQEILYSANPPPQPPPPLSNAPPVSAYHHGYLPAKGPVYHPPPPPPPPPLQRRYIPALPPQQYFHHDYPPPVSTSQQQVIVPAHPLAAAAVAAAAAAAAASSSSSSADSYHSAPPTPSVIESYPPPPPPSLYYSGYSSAPPPTPYYPYATSSRSLTLVETSCPCPLQGCQKNVDTGPLTGFISKGPVEQRNTPLSPVALSLPKEPHDIRSLPSPARGSAGSRPTPSPAIATAKNPSSWNEGCDYGCDTAGLLTISKAAGATVFAAVDSAVDLDSGIDGICDMVDARVKRRNTRRELKKMKLRRFKSSKSAHEIRADDECVGKLCPAFLDGGVADAQSVGIDAVCAGFISATSVANACVSRVKSNCTAAATIVELCESTDACVSSEPTSIKRQNCKIWRRDQLNEEDDDDDHDDGDDFRHRQPHHHHNHNHNHNRLHQYRRPNHDRFNRRHHHRQHRHHHYHRRQRHHYLSDQSADVDSHSDSDMPPKLYPEVDFEYEKRLRRDNDDLSPKTDDAEPPFKKSKNTSSTSPLFDGVVDLEKSNYLSALQLRSVSDVSQPTAYNALTSTVAVVTTSTTSTSTSTVSNVASVTSFVESLAPLNGYSDERVKVAADTRASDDAGRSKRTQTEHAIPPTSSVDDCPPCGMSSDASARCKTWSQIETRKPRFRRRRWTTKKKSKKKKTNKGSKGSEEEKLEAENAERRRRAELLSLTQKRATCRLKWSNGWMWLGEPYVAKVFMNTEGPEVLRTCYHAMKHQSGDIVRPKDCILLRSGSKKTDLPYVAKVAHLWEDPEDGEMMMSLFWYYRPEHTEHDAVNSESPYELYASKHKDVNSVACIEDKCYVLTFNEYCRYHKSIRQAEESVDVSSVIVPPLGKKRYPRQALLPPENTSLDLVYFCRKIYDFRQHRLLKNPFFV